ncbi:MAG: SIS domain-containing protein [Tepidimonas sp.]|uniref:SIS domain-containing protein n=1 Tax=Tepidimonas sp. TaxID=2002775 RepID=UPI004054CC45
MLLHRIQQHFVDGADLQYQCAQAVSPAVEAAVSALLAGLTGGGKVLALGSGVSAALAQSFAAQLVGRFERERPELAALALGTNPAFTTGAVLGNEMIAWPVVRQLRALGQPGDVLLVIAAAAPSADVLAAVAAAHEREMVVVALTGARPSDLPDALKDTDVLVTVPAERPARVHEAHLVVLHAICDAIDVQLLGDDTEAEIIGP